MTNLNKKELYSLEDYDTIRKDFRQKVMAHKKNRCLEIGNHVLLTFEDKLTMQYQVQEMLRIEKIFSKAEIDEELATYNPLIPDGSNFKATMLIQFTEVAVRQQQLTKLIGIENKTWLQVEGFEKIFAIADEDLERDNAEKTSAVHFLRFELNPKMVAAVKVGTTIFAGISHENYQQGANPIPKNIRNALAEDLILQ